MARRESRKNRRGSAKQKKQRGAGFFNRVRSFFTRKAPAVVPMPPQTFAAATYARPSQVTIPQNYAQRLSRTATRRAATQKRGFFRNFLRKPRAVPEPEPILTQIPKYPTMNTQLLTARRAAESEQASFGSEMDRIFAWMYQKYKKTPQNLSIEKLTPQQLSELRRAALLQMSQTGKVQQPKDQNDFSQALFGVSVNEFNRELAAIEKRIPKSGLKPTSPAGSLPRLLSLLMKTDREMEQTKNKERYWCNAMEGSDSIKSLKNVTCIAVDSSIPRWLSVKEELPGLEHTLFVIVNPRFYPNDQRYKQNQYNLSAGRQPDMILSNELEKVSFVRDALDSRNGVTLIHPRLGFLILREFPQLWSEQTSQGSRLGKAEMITLLTLQKQAAIRRQMWTKDPKLAGEVQSSHPLDIANELRAPYFELQGPDNRESSKFDSKEFFRELRENQIWAIGYVKQDSQSDPGLDSWLSLPRDPLQNSFLPVPKGSKLSVAQRTKTLEEAFPWFRENLRKNVEKTRIPALPEEAVVREETARLYSTTQRSAQRRNRTMSRRNAYEKILSSSGTPKKLQNMQKMSQQIRQSSALTPAMNRISEEQIEELENRFNINLGVGDDDQ